MQLFKFKKKSKEVQDIDLNKLERESNTRQLEELPNILMTIYLACFTIFQIYSSISGTIPVQILRMSHLGFVIPACFWLYPASIKDDSNKLTLLDSILGFVFLGVVTYYLLNYNALIDRIGSYNSLDLIVGALGLILLLEACRRSVGLPIVIIALVFIVYVFFGQYFPGFLNHKGYSMNRVISQLFYSTEGIIGTPIGVCATFVFLFILFGSFLENTGIGLFFNDLSNAIAGSKPGGPAKVAIISSGLQGTVSGSSISNVMGTGAFTIPMMKSLGYEPEFAAGVEAAASTGGQIMPPIMGAAAFLIAETIGVNYFDVAKSGIIPAFLFFAGIYIMVHLTAKKEKLVGLPKDEIPSIKMLLAKKGHLILPLLVIVVLLAMKYTITRSVLWAILAAIIAPYLRRNTRVPFEKILSCFINGAKGILSVSCACAVAGIIVGVVTMSGLGLTLGGGLLSLTKGLLIPTLFFTMVTSIILGMGLPTTANYLITSTIAAPIIIKLGIPILPAHLFVFYFGIMSDITPPVALAAYAGAAIAKANPFKTGVYATKLAIAGFLVPYIFVLNPQMLLIDVTALGIIQIVITSLIGMLGVSSSLTGYLITNNKWFESAILSIGGLLMVYPGTITDLVGISLILSAYLMQKRRFKIESTVSLETNQS